MQNYMHHKAGKDASNPIVVQKWQDFWGKIVDRYDGDSSNDMPELTKSVKYWNI